MPLIRIEVGEQRINQQTVTAIIEKVTDAFLEAIDEESMRDQVWCVVQGVPTRQWGIGGEPVGDWSD